MNSLRPIRLAVFSLALATAALAADATLNTLTDTEKRAGWKLLFDGKTLAGWHGLKQPGPPANGWVVQAGVLTCLAGGNGGDLFSNGTYDNFEFSWEWSMPPKSNNGVKYFVREDRGAIGHEYQMIDDTLEPDPMGVTGSFYLVVAPNAAKKKVKPFGEWNQSRVVVQGNHVEHWLNGEKVLEYECGSPAVLTQVNKTKFKTIPGFGTKVRGPLLLTYHKDEASFRNLKLRELPAK